MKRTLPRVLVLLLVTHAGFAASAEAQTARQSGGTLRRVLALFWYPSDHPTSATFNRHFQAALREQASGETEYYAEYFESARFPGESQARILRDYLHQKYRDRKIDVLLVWGGIPLRFLLTHRRDLFPNTPIVYYVGTLEAIRDFEDPPLTGVINVDAYEKTLEAALSLHPDTREAFIISGTPTRDKLVEREVSQQIEKYRGRVALTYLTDLPLDQLIATVKGLPRQSLILYSRQSLEEPGRVLFPSDFLSLISSAASVPVYSPWKSLVGHGTVGGLIDDPEAGARKAAEIVLRVARGARPQDIPPARVPKIPTFDARQLQRWNIPEAALPAGSVILHRAPTFWSVYRSYILVAGLAFGIQTLLIGGLIVQRARRRRVEGALRESETRFRLMADTAPVMIWRSDVDKAFDFFNRPWLDFRGRSLLEEVGSGWIEGVHPADLEQCLATYSSAFDARQMFNMEYRLRRADGQYRWVLDSGVPRFAPDGTFAGYIGSCFDITERREAAQALQASERRYALATTAGAVGVWDWSLATNDIWVDPALKRALGYEDVEIANTLDSWLALVHPEDAGQLLMDAYAHVNGESKSFENEHRMLHRDGSIRWFVTRGSVVRPSDGSAIRITGTDTDITERKNAEIRLEESRHELARVSRVTTLAQFAASVAHETSQPLHAILLNATACLNWLEDPARPVDELRVTLRDIANAARQASEIITRNHGVFSRHPIEKQIVDMNDIVRDVAALARTRLHKGRVDLDMALEPDLPGISGDRIELQQVLLNLLINAIEAVELASPASRQIWIRTTSSDGAQVHVSVRDTGIGLRDTDVEDLFTAFYTTKPTGTGVGLSISRFIIEDHGGRLWAEPNGDSGATFTFTIPIAKLVDCRSRQSSAVSCQS